MAGLGEDIRKVYGEIGRSFNILKIPSMTVTSGEYLDAKLNSQATKPFIREHFLECSLQYNTNVESGDVINFEKTGTYHIAMHLTADLFEDELYEYSTVLYKCNASGELQRPSSERDATSYLMSQDFDVVYGNCYALQTVRNVGYNLEYDQDIAAYEIKNDFLYLPSGYGARVGDRYQIASGEYLMIDVIETHRFPGVDAAKLTNDVR